MKKPKIEPGYAAFLIDLDPSTSTAELMAYAVRLVNWAKEAGHDYAQAAVMSNSDTGKRAVELDGLYLRDGYTRLKSIVNRAAKELAEVGFRPTTPAPTKEHLA